MANPIHVDLVKKGTKSINEWRKDNPNQTLELSGEKISHIDLQNANLSPICLSKATLYFVNLFEADLAKSDLTNITIGSSVLFAVNFFEANLSNATILDSSFNESNLNNANISKSNISSSTFIKANFSGVNLIAAINFENNFTFADFSNANLTKSDMAYCNFKFCNLMKTNFSHAKLTGVIFEQNEFNASKLTGAEMEFTKFTSCDLSRCIGLTSIKHKSPGNIDLQTIKKSLFSSKYCLEPGFKKFLFSSGFPMELIQQLPKILGDIKYYSAFVCYGEPDRKFAEKLRNDLENEGVSCWLYSLDATIGKRTWKEISQKRREAERMIILCSSDSLVRDGVLKEIEEQIDEDPEKIIPISLDNLWKQEGFRVKRGQRDLKPFLIERNYADFVVKSKYKQSINKLLKGLKKSK